MFRTLQTVVPKTAVEQSAYDKWLDQTSAREEARRDRVHGAVGVIPTQLWIVLFFIAAVIFVYMLFFADSGERSGRAGHVDGSGRLGDDRAATAAQRARQPVPLGRGRARASRDGALAAHHRRSARRGSGTGAAFRATRSGRRRRDERRRGAQLGGARRHRPSRRRHRRDRMERLPVDPLERRAGKGCGPRERAAHRLVQGRRRREQRDRDRRRHIHAVGQRICPGADGARGLLLQALPQGVQARGRRMDRDQAAQESRRRR